MIYLIEKWKRGKESEGTRGHGIQTDGGKWKWNHIMGNASRVPKGGSGGTGMPKQRFMFC